MAFLSEQGFDPSSGFGPKGKFGVTAMCVASFHGRLDVCRYIIQRESTSPFTQLLNPERGGQTPMIKACRGGHLPVAQWLFECAGEDSIHATDTLGQTPLHFACQGGHAHVVSWLLHVGAAPGIKRPSFRFMTPFMLASSNLFVPVCQVLILWGALNGRDGHISRVHVRRDSLKGIWWALHGWTLALLTARDSFRGALLGTLRDQSPLRHLRGLAELRQLVGAFVGLEHGRRLRNARELADAMAASVDMARDFAGETADSP